jgi:hypothetical protein
VEVFEMKEQFVALKDSPSPQQYMAAVPVAPEPGCDELFSKTQFVRLTLM